MENRVAVVSIVVEAPESVELLNGLLHEYRAYILGRMGIPHKERGISLISLVMDAPADALNSLSGKLGQLPGISAKTLYAKV